MEIHIEQGPTLELEDIPVGLVTGISGSFRYRTGRCLGTYGHSGAVPRRHRQDAVMALADLAMKLDRFWEENERPETPLTITFGQVATDPSQHAFSKVPGEVSFCLDVRSTSTSLVEKTHEAMLAFAKDIEEQRGVRFDGGRVLQHAGAHGHGSRPAPGRHRIDKTRHSNPSHASGRAMTPPSSPQRRSVGDDLRPQPERQPQSRRSDAAGGSRTAIALLAELLVAEDGN